MNRTFSPASAAPGGQVTVTGGDFGYETTVTLFLDRAGGAGAAR